MFFESKSRLALNLSDSFAGDALPELHLLVDIGVNSWLFSH
jgi:hypothetical protein